MALPVVLIALIVFGYVFAATRTGTVHSVPLGARRLTVVSSLAPQEIIARLRAGVEGFEAEHADPAIGAVLLSSRPTLATWGFFYPVLVSEAADGTSRVEIGISSKLFQWGPLVTRWHHRCRDAVERAVGDQLGLGELPTARVV